MSILFKEIKIQPSVWHLDIIVCANPEKIGKFLNKRYGIPIHELYDKHILDCTTVIEGMKGSDIGEEKRVVVTLASKDIVTLVHELVHVLWHASSQIGFEMEWESQEWQALLFENLFIEAKNFKSYKKLSI